MTLDTSTTADATAGTAQDDQTATLNTMGTDPATGFRTEVAMRVPLNLIKPGAFQPRKRFDADALNDLADSIRAHGVQQAIVLRLVAGAKAGEPRYEIVAGERRWRASKLLAESGNYLAPHTIPAFVRELDDFAASEIALTENSNRNDLHPLEEAQAYENLLLHPVGGGDFTPARLRGYTVEQLAERVGHKPNYVFGRIKLLDLVPAAKEAFLEGTLQLKVAERLARMGAGEQERALPGLMQGWGGEPFTHRQAMAYLRDHYMLKLGKAVFAIADADLLAKAGACTSCPKRSSANPDLFGDMGSDDMCLDGTCYQAKTAAHSDHLLEQARAKGLPVLTGAAAKKAFGGYEQISDYTLRSSNYLNLDKSAEELTGNKKALRTLIGTDFAGVKMVKAEHDDLPITVAKMDDVKAALKAKGLLKPATKSKPGQPGKVLTVADIKAHRKQRLHDLMSGRLPGAVWKHLAADGAEGFPDTQGWMRSLVDKVYEACSIDFDALQRAVSGKNELGFGWIDALDTEGLARLAVTMMLCDSVNEERWRMEDKPEVANGLAEDIRLDLPALRSEVEEEVDSGIRDEIEQLAEVVEPEAPRKASLKKPAARKSSKGTVTQPTRAAAKGQEEAAEVMTPEKALAAAVQADQAEKVDGDKLEQVAWPFPTDTDKSATGNPIPTLSAAAAWPFPEMPASSSSPAPGAQPKASKVRKAKAAAVKASASSEAA